ncbi:MAG: extracellular solute-binding protein [Candidatus Limiplasma sp.]|nr:extracellular solute-binding protein [Candidatus Limiplasma sp.]
MRKLLSLLLCAVLLAGLAAPALAETATLKVWGSQEDQAMLQEMIDAFKAANPDKAMDVTLGVVGEPDARARYAEDPAAAADVFAFPNDQLYDLVNSGSLYEVTLNKDAIIAANGAGSIEAASVGDALYAYPMTADNGYFLYYDKSVVSEEAAQTLDGILAACNAAGKKMFMDVSNGWYIASFFLGAGCTLTLEDGKQLCDFNNEKGLAAAEAIKAFTADPAFLTGDDAVLTGSFGEVIAAGVSGMWTAGAIKEKLGDNFAATKLPTFTLNGEQVQMSSFAGYKLIGVNSLTQYPLEAMALAEWLTNEENQLKRFEMREAGPSNVNAAASEAVKTNVPLAALALQGQFATSQKDVLGNYWTPAEAFGAAMEAKDYSMPLQEMLDVLVQQVTAQ